MEIEFDPVKRDVTLQIRGLDMAHAPDIFAGATLTVEDNRKDYGEPRYITIGFLANRMVVPCMDATRQGTPDHQHEESQ